jgi:hypothetical protein
VIFADSLPGFKSLLRPLDLPWHFLSLVAAFVAAFALHRGSTTFANWSGSISNRRWWN